MNLGISLSLQSTTSLIDIVIEATTFGVGTFTASQAAAGAPLVMDVVFTEADTRTPPLTGHVVLTASGETPSVDQIIAGDTDDDTDAAHAFNTAIAEDGSLSGAITGVAAGTYDVHFAAVDDTGRKTTAPARALAVTIAEPITALATHLGQQFVNPTNGLSTVTRVIDVSSMTAGDRLLVTMGSLGYVTNPTIDGVAVAGADSSIWAEGFSWTRAAVIWPVITSTQIATGTVTIGIDPTTTGAANSISFDAVATSAATISVDFDYPYTRTATITNASNAVFHFQWGAAAKFNNAGMVYDGASDMQNRLYNENTGVSGIAAGLLLDEPIGTSDIIWTMDSGGASAGLIVTMEAA